MTVLPCANYRRFVNGYELNITMRLVGTNEIEFMTPLMVHTTRVYVYLTKLIEAGATIVPPEHNLSAEMAINTKGYVFEAFVEARVTIFCWNHKIDLTLHSSDTPQDVLNLYYANEAAKVELDKLYPQNAPQTNVAPVSSASMLSQPTNTPEAPKTAVDGVNYVKGYKDAKSLPIGSQFAMKVAKIKAAMNEDGVLTWKLFGFYGKQPGKFPEFTVFSDNEFANKSGLAAKLNAICSTAGMAVEGNWLASGNISEGDGKTYVNIQDVA